MKTERTEHIILSIVKQWWFSLILIIPVWVVTEYAVTGLSKGVTLTLNYPFFFPLSLICFLLDSLTLILHEGGHTIFGIFGWRLLEIAGGTLMQILIPFALFLNAWFRYQHVFAQFNLFWLGMSWYESSIYCADAYYQELPLIGNLPKSAHDFTNLLSSFNALDNYMNVAWTMFAIGGLCMVLSILYPSFKRKVYDYVDLEYELKKSGLR